MNKKIPIVRAEEIVIGFLILVCAISWAFFLFCRQEINSKNPPYFLEGPRKLVTVERPTQVLPPERHVEPEPYSDPRFHPTLVNTHLTFGTATVTESSPKVFSYAHGTTVANGKFFIGMAARAANPFPANELVIFNDPANLSSHILITLPHAGDVQTMVANEKAKKVYFTMSGENNLELYAIDTVTYRISNLVSTTTIDSGPRPAIVTDGDYVYGITDTDPATVFKVSLKDGSFTSNSLGNIAHGHSAAIGQYGSTTELYFGGGMSNGFQKVSAEDLKVLAKIDVGPCSESDDMPYAPLDEKGGYVYIGCEMEPRGYRIKTENMSVSQFTLPGYSLGLFIYDSNLYNSAQDGHIDVFPNLDLTDLNRFKLEQSLKDLTPRGQVTQLNEFLYSPETDSLYFTAWWGVQGLYKVYMNL